jgi:ABC-type transport system involved in cytochrome c biogenesis permease subunit
MNDPLRIFVPAGFVVLALVGFLICGFPPEEAPGGMNVEATKSIPVQVGGRVKPLDTFARTTMLSISNRQTFKDLDDETRSATFWLLEVMSSSLKLHMNRHSAAMDYEVFRIDNDEVRGMLNLEPRSGFRYAPREIIGKSDQIAHDATRARQIEALKRNRYEAKVLELAEHLQAYVNVAQLEQPTIVPPGADGEEWASPIEVLRQEKLDPKKAKNPYADNLWSILTAYAAGDAEDFNTAVAQYRQNLSETMPDEMATVEAEATFNRIAPFYQCTWMYILVFVLGCLSWVVWREYLGWSAFWVCALTWVIHTIALGTRMYLQGRPPVTNLYSSAVFIGWGAVLFCLALEWIFRLGVGTVVGSVLGFATSIIAHHLAQSSGDTLEMMQAVLDTNFWLATHVTCVTLGYSITFVAGFIGMVFIFTGLFTRAMNRNLLKSLGQMLYGTICCATLLSFVGTVLGGIWADQSWGRFWGWDPKENGAVLIVIWNALILHARWGGMVKQRGMAVLAVLGNMVTAWSWFGTNQLGVGLHAYGFNNTLATGLVVVWLAHLVIAGIGMIPMDHWRSFSPKLAPVVLHPPLAEANLDKKPAPPVSKGKRTQRVKSRR